MADSKSKIMQYKELILALAALAAGVSGWLKPPDTAAAERTHTMGQAQLQAMATDLKAQQQDLANLRGYLSAYMDNHAEPEVHDHDAHAEPAAPEVPVVEAPRAKRRAPRLPKLTARKVHTYKEVSFEQLLEEPEVEAFIEQMIEQEMAPVMLTDEEIAEVEAEVRREMREEAAAMEAAR